MKLYFGIYDHGTLVFSIGKFFEGPPEPTNIPINPAWPKILKAL